MNVSPPTLQEIVASVSSRKKIAVSLLFEQETLVALDWLAEQAGQSRDGMLTNLVLDKYLKILRGSRPT